jgi:hypothetical protein
MKMNEREYILNLAEKYNLIVTKTYTLNNNNKVDVVYMLLNGPKDTEMFFESEEFKSLNIGSDEFSKRLFILYDIRYSQENEFYID